MLTGIYWRRELQQVWNKDSFLRSGGTAKTSKRRGENFNELYAACHAAEDKLKELTLKHGKAAKGTLKGKGQQENVAPTDKRRDALRCLAASVTLHVSHCLYSSAYQETESDLDQPVVRQQQMAYSACGVPGMYAGRCAIAELRKAWCHVSMKVIITARPWQSVFLPACLLGHSSSEQGGHACCTYSYEVRCSAVMLCICSWHAITLLMLACSTPELQVGDKNEDAAAGRLPLMSPQCFTLPCLDGLCIGRLVNI